VALMQIHTSCSKPLFKDMIVDDSEFTNNGYSLKVVDGLLGGDSSIPIATASICEDEKKKSMGSITVRKAVNNDNGGEATFEDFTISVTNVDTPESPIVLGNPNMDNQSYSQDVPAGIYTLSETSPDGYNTIMVTGDTGCPSTVNEPFTIKKNKNLSCTIYNDDKSTGSSGLNDFVFQKNSIKINHDDDTLLQSCKAVPTPSPCIEIIDSATIAIVDPKLESTSTIVLFSVFGELTSTNLSIQEPACIMTRLLPHNEISTDAAAGTTLSVILECANFDVPRVYNINYVFINPMNVP